MGPKYLDELHLGDVFYTASRTITEADVVIFAGLTGDYTEIHTSRTMAESTQFGQRIAHGILVLAYAHGLFMATKLTTPTGIALAGIENWKFIAPVFFGDTIEVRITVSDIIPSRSKKDRGIVKFLFEVIKQDGTVVQQGTKVIMMKRSPEGIEHMAAAAK